MTIYQPPSRHENLAGHPDDQVGNITNKLIVMLIKNSNDDSISSWQTMMSQFTSSHVGLRPINYLIVVNEELELLFIKNEL